MPKLEFLKSTSYHFAADGKDVFVNAKRGEVPPIDFPEAEAANLVAGGNAKVIDEPATEQESNDGVREQVPGGEGSKDPVVVPGEDEKSGEPDELVCEECGDGRVFATKAALGSHKSARH